MPSSGDGRRGRRRRLSRSGEFERVYREGRSHANRHLVVYTFPRTEADGEARLGISVGRKVGGAVDRNRVKRLVRDAFWEHARTLSAGHDYVIVARPPARELAEREGAEGIATAMRELLRSAKLIDAEST